MSVFAPSSFDIPFNTSPQGVCPHCTADNCRRSRRHRICLGGFCFYTGHCRVPAPYRSTCQHHWSSPHNSSLASFLRYWKRNMWCSAKLEHADWRARYVFVFQFKMLQLIDVILSRPRCWRCRGSFIVGDRHC